jgi:hypothetical protein
MPGGPEPSLNRDCGYKREKRRFKVFPKRNAVDT